MHVRLVHQTIDQFANPLGLDFLEAFLERGESVGAVLRHLRGRVPLGLLYGTYCPPDIRVDRGFPRDTVEISQLAHMEGTVLTSAKAADTRPAPLLPDEPYRSLAYYDRDDRALFAGRDDEYLKAPGNAVRLTRFASAVNVDFVWTPVFASDVYLTGERFSFFSPLAGGNVAPNPPLSAIEPEKTFSNGEFALRLFRTVEGNEYALYAYHGFFKQPSALTPQLQATFAPMTSFGASLRRPAGPGLFNTEVSYYISRDDRSGSDPLLPNDQLRFLLGYEWEAKPNFTVGFQYYLERTMDHDELLANSPFPQYEPDENRHLFTNRLTFRAGMDKYTWSLFTFYSPSDGDAYLRPKFAYRHSDQWSLEVGGNLFGGDQPHTFFSQLEDASNAWLRLRFHY